MKFFLGLTAALLSSLAAHALTTADLGQGLTYVRFAEGESDLGKLSALEARVIDLRGAKFPATTAAELLNALTRSSDPSKTLSLVLIDAETSAPLAQALAHPPARVLTLAPASAQLTADLTLNISDEEQKALREAFEKNTPVTELLPAPTTKERRDEATLVQEHTNGAPLPIIPPEKSEAEKTDPAKATPPPLTDRLLQRAVQLHRAHTALK